MRLKLDRSAVLGCLTTLVGCQGLIGGPSDGRIQSDVAGLCGATPSPGSAPMRRLSHNEYLYSITDVLPSAGQVAAQQVAQFLPDSVSLGFQNNANFLTVSPVLAQQYMDSAEAISQTLVGDPSFSLGCDPQAMGERPCALQFIGTLGRRLYRRALTTDDLSAYGTVFDTARASYDFNTAVEWMVFTLLNSPGFLYRAELDNGAAPGTVRSVAPLELASRLSFLFWQSVPDEELLSAAEQGNLASRADVLREANRMIADPKSRRVTDFFEQWLNVTALKEMVRDPTVFPNLDPNLPSLLQGEVSAFVQGVVFDGDGKLPTLLSAPYTYANAELAKHYGYSGPTGTTYQQVAYPGRREGLLMLGGVLAARDKANRTSIVRRGLSIRTQVLCQYVPAPPPNVPPLGPVNPNQSQADLLAQHRTDPFCASCHNRMDPIGQVFENVDAVGRDRTVDEAGRPVATTGELTGTLASDGPLTDGKDLADRLSGAAEVRDCFSLQYYRFAMGRQEETGDACSRGQLRAQFASSGSDIKQLLLSLTQTDDFLYRAAAAP